MKIIYDDLLETINLMKSSDYKERFKAEYLQTKIRYERLKNFNNKIEAASELNNCADVERSVVIPKHDCPAYLLRSQQGCMGEYLHILELRAEIEGIDLNTIDIKEDK